MIGVRAITFDFGNTLVRVDRPGLRSVVVATATALRAGGVIHDDSAFLVAWAEERDRQFREEVPQFREVDVPQRAVRVLARLRGMAPPAPEGRWDDAAAARLSNESEVALVADAYSAAFVDRMAPVDDAFATLERLAGRGFTLGILSNWPLAVTIDRFAEANGWLPILAGIVVSQRVGTIKPHPSIFTAARDLLAQGAEPERFLHVGDDWAADVVGARAAGWRAAYLRDRQSDTPLPTSEPGDAMLEGEGVRADLEIDELSDLDAHVELAGAAPTAAGPTAAGPTATGPTATGPTATGPTVPAA